MQKHSPKTEFERFFTSMTQYTDLLVKIIGTKKVIIPQHKKEEISVPLSIFEKQQIHEAFVLKICAIWEILVEDVLVECLRCDTSSYSKTKGITLPKKLTKNLCKGLVSGLGYFDFRDMGDLRGKAKKILADNYNPFKEILPREIKKINEFYIMRNYIAHRSNTSKQALMRMYKSRYGMEKFRQPGDFLFDIIGFTEVGERGKQIRFADYSSSFMTAADQLAAFLDIQ